MMDMSSWMFIFVMSIGCGIACTIIAWNKGYRGSRIFGWLAAGLIFSVFGLIAVTLTSHGHDDAQAAIRAHACPHCGTLLPASIAQCTHCGASVAGAM